MKLLFITLFGLLSLSSFSQDPSFALFNQNLNYNNPAFVGTASNFRITNTFRNQWPGISGNYVTNSFSADQYFGKWGGAGIIMTNDVAGNVIYTNSYHAQYSYGFDLGDSGRIQFGTSLGVVQKRIDWDQVTFGDCIDPQTGFICDPISLENPSPQFDPSFGMVYYNDKFFAGYAIHHINEPNVSVVGGDSPLPIKHVLLGGYQQSLGAHKIALNSQFLWQENFSQLNMNLQYRFKWLFAGIGLRPSEAIMASLGVQIKKFRIVYNYDNSISAFSTSTGGSHDISMQLRLDIAKKSNPRAFLNY